MERLAHHISKNKGFREIAIPGGFDLFHQNHKDFITKCINHAEINCLEKSQPRDALITTMGPCLNCSEKIVEKGIERVVYLDPYHNNTANDYLVQNGVKVRRAGI